MYEITHNNIPEALIELHRKMDLLVSMVQTRPEADSKRLLSLLELRDYLPEHPANQTVYGWVNDRKVPFEKFGKRLYFRKSDIDVWLANGRQIITQ